MTTVILKASLAVPSSVIVDVASVLLEHDLQHQIVETDDEEDTITLELEYEREQRDVIHQIEDLINDYEEGEDDDEEEEDEKDEEDEDDR